MGMIAGWMGREGIFVAADNTLAGFLTALRINVCERWALWCMPWAADLNFGAAILGLSKLCCSVIL
jgi:hypothetical protein